MSDHWRVTVIGDGIRLEGTTDTERMEQLCWVSGHLDWLVLYSPSPTPPDPTPPLSGVGG